MVFKRRDRRPFLRILGEFFYPRGGWGRAARYVQHRLRRLPGSPETIGRGIWAGVFTTFTPFYTMHFVVAALLSRILGGNLLAALLATFFGNPLTYLPIGIVSLKTGHFLLGTEFEEGDTQSLGGKFANAGADLWHNFWTLFTDDVADWHGLRVFYDEVFFPYMVGGILPGIIAATVMYYISVPLIRAYQKRRSAKFAARIAKARAMAEEQAAHVHADN
ncbi:DUF2062 domain-containing protein [Shimia marina]|uniref:DUF2062 domain-containing protein n=1 Tax=Shimia marina TaxID=321267 RepID=A0A0P1FF55_9RHOB|nr:DUF2062 domain-containing protein [Shimia marina]CUH53953.1 hypothetical protein SHM7688_03422 [Shimia marina]SFE18398.1 hypothetical protein SAMN04488037_10688 [Shimia marina]